MEVQIEEVQSTVHATDSEALLNQGLMRRIVQAVLAELNARQERETRWQGERRLAQGSSDARRQENRP